MDIILTSIKKLLGIDTTDTNFDPDIIVFLNGIVETLRDIGVSPASEFTKIGADTTWANYLGADHVCLNSITTYMYLKTKLVFDPPPSSFVLESIKSVIQQEEWRIALRLDPPLVEEVIPDEL